MEKPSPVSSSATSGNKKTQTNKDFFGERGYGSSLFLFASFSIKSVKKAYMTSRLTAQTSSKVHIESAHSPGAYAIQRGTLCQ